MQAAKTLYVVAVKPTPALVRELAVPQRHGFKADHRHANLDVRLCHQIPPVAELPHRWHRAAMAMLACAGHHRCQHRSQLQDRAAEEPRTGQPVSKSSSVDSFFCLRGYVGCACTCRSASKSNNLVPLHKSSRSRHASLTHAHTLTRTSSCAAPVSPSDSCSAITSWARVCGPSVGAPAAPSPQTCLPKSASLRVAGSGCAANLQRVLAVNISGSCPRWYGAVRLAPWRRTIPAGCA